MNDHPVWTVYDELRTAKLNVYYYASRLARARRWHTTRELIMALSGSTGVAGIWFFATAPGSIVWKGLATASALLAVYHSVTRPSEVIRKLETQVTGWAQLTRALADIRRRIHECGRYDAPLQREVQAALDHNKAVAIDLVETDVDEKLRSHCFERVKEEMPEHVFFVPDSPGTHPLPRANRA